MVVHYFKNLFARAYNNCSTLDLIHFGVPQISYTHYASLMEPFKDSKIYDIVFQMQPNRAIRIDGFIVRFY